MQSRASFKAVAAAAGQAAVASPCQAGPGEPEALEDEGAVLQPEASAAAAFHQRVLAAAPASKAAGREDLASKAGEPAGRAWKAAEPEELQPAEGPEELQPQGTASALTSTAGASELLQEQELAALACRGTPEAGQRSNPARRWNVDG